MVVYQITMTVSCYYTAFIIIGKFAIILSGELASNDTTMTEQVCEVSNNSMDMVNLEQRCFLSCIESDSRTWNYTLSNLWPYVNINETDCETSRDLYQCILGCVHSDGGSSHLYDCFYDCLDTCDNSIMSLQCDGLTPLCHPWISQQCTGTVDCINIMNGSRAICTNGCEKGSELPDKKNASQVPPAPEGPPWLIPVQDSEIAGEFFVDLSGAIPQRRSCESTIENAALPVVFLFKFEDVNSHNISFNWTETPFALLNLTGYACQELQVSFAVGNVAGLSEFSPAATIKANMNETISTINPPLSITVEELVDEQVGFFGHVILIVSWIGSHNEADVYFDHFIVTIVPYDEVTVTNKRCGCNTWSRTIPRDQNTVLVNATSNGFLLLMSCQYTIQIRATGPYGTSYPLMSIHSVNSSFDPNSIDFECQRLWQLRGFSFNLTWILPDQLRLGNVIDEFVVLLKLTDGIDNISVLVDNSTIPFQDQKESQNFSVIFNSSNQFVNASFHLFEMYVNWNSDIPYIPPRYFYDCMISTVSPRPYPVEDFMVTSSCSINDSTIIVYIDWFPPSIINGVLESYDICLGNVPLEPSEEISNESHNCHNSKLNNQVHSYMIDTKSSYPLYIQIRANNFHISGNWSEPYVTDSMCNESSTTSSNETSTSTSSGPDESSTTSSGTNESSTTSSGTDESPTAGSGTNEFPTMSSGTEESSTTSSGANESSTTSSGTDESPTASSDTNESSTTSSGTDESPTASSTTDESPIDGSGTDESPIAGSGTNESSTTSSGTDESSTTSSGTNESSTISSGTDESSTTSSGTNESSTTSSGTDESSTTSSGTDKSPTASSGPNESSTTSSGTDESSTTSSGTDESPTTSSSTDESPTTSSSTDEFPTMTTGPDESPTTSRGPDESFITKTCAISNNSMSMVELQQRCFLSCDESDFGTWNYSLSNYWPYVNVDETDCQTSRDLYQCTLGCVQYHSESNSFCLFDCQDTCESFIKTLKCDGLTPLCHPWISQQCLSTFECHRNEFLDRNPCKRGCKLGDNLQMSVPPAPEGPPWLIPVQDSEIAGQFIIDLSDTIPQRHSCESTVENAALPVVFLFKFEDMNSHNILFNWTETPFAHLNLTAYACKQLQVSFAVGNIAGISEFSPTATIQVNMNKTISTFNPPSSLTVEELVDTRVGFFGHVILNVSWIESHNESDVYFAHFIVTIAPHHEATRCGYNTWSRTIPRDQNAVAVEATSSLFLPLMSCQYIIQIRATGPYGTSYPLTNIHDVNTSFDPNSIKFECQRLWQIRGFSFNLTWILPDQLRNAIDEFVVLLKLIDGTDNISIIIDNSTIPFQDQKEMFSVVFNSRNHSVNAFFHLFETHVNWSSEIRYIPPRHVYDCMISTVSPQPYPVEDLMVTSSCSINDSTIILFIEWSPPSIINGILESYDICLGNVSLESSEEISNESHDCRNSKQNKQMNSYMIVTKGMYPLYIQIRANNFHISGNWSEVYVMDSPVSMCDESSTISSGIMSGGIDAFSSKNNYVGTLAGSLTGSIVIFLLALSCLTIALYFVCYKRRRSKMLRIMTQEPYDSIFHGRSNTIILARRPTVLQVTPQPDKWEIPAKEIIMEKLLGEGAFGEVYKGVVKCPIVNPKVRSSSMKKSICTPVAIKLLKLTAEGNARNDFLSEIEMMKKVAEGQNCHVISLVGCVTIQEPLSLITEFVKYGDLLSYLRSNRRRFTGSSTKGDHDAYVELGNVSSVDLISFAYQIASGMEYLTSLGIVHRDLACRNILVDEGKLLKITDFGLSRETDEIYVQQRKGRVPLKWMAIESIIAREFTSASDVWSFGVVLWEIGTLGGIPYPSIANEDLLSRLMGGYRMKNPDNCSAKVYDIMLMCWNEQAQERPSFSDLRSKFDAMLLEDKKDQYIDLHNIDQKSDPKGTVKKYLSRSATELDHSQFQKCFSDATDGHGGAEKDQSKADQTMLLRPLSMNIAHDHAGNPYVDLPSKVGTTATASLMLPPGATY